MNFDILWAAPWYIQVHAIAALSAFVLGTVQYLSPKGTLPHKTIGTIWIVLMLAVAGSSAFIQHPTEPGDPFWARFSWIHILTVVTFVGVLQGVFLILRRGPKFKRHGRAFLGAYLFGLIIAGFFAFMPGRMMHDILFNTCHAGYSDRSICSSE